MIIEIANAITTNASIIWEQVEFWDFILIAISLFVLFAWVFSIVYILWWGLLLILSWGKDDKIKPAINTIRYAVIGIIITVITIFIFPILWRLLGLDVEKYAEPKRIFEKIDEIWNKIFWSKNYKPTNTDIQNLDSIPADFSDL